MARREKGTDKWRADIQVNGKRKTKLCATEEEAKKLEAHYQHQLIDGKPLNKVRAISQITLKQAFEKLSHCKDDYDEAKQEYAEFQTLLKQSNTLDMNYFETKNMIIIEGGNGRKNIPKSICKFETNDGKILIDGEKLVKRSHERLESYV